MPTNPDSSPRSSLLYLALTAVGFTDEQARAWASRKPARASAALVVPPREWRTTYIPPEDAVRWHRAGWQRAEAAQWWLTGFTPAQAAFVVHRLQAATVPPPDGCGYDDLVHEWFISGISVKDIVLCIASGYLNLDSAIAAVNAMNQDQSLRCTLILQALLKGVDLRALEDDTP